MSLALSRARLFAELRHGSQPYGRHPYTYHLDRVVELLRYALEHDLSAHEHLLTAGYLHDILEDTRTTKEELASIFGTAVADLVALVTDPEGKNRKERKAKLYVFIAHSPLRDFATAIKLADRCANLEECLKDAHRGTPGNKLEMYQREQQDFELALRTQAKITKSLWQHLDWLFTMAPLPVL